MNFPNSYNALLARKRSEKKQEVVEDKYSAIVSKKIEAYKKSVSFNTVLIYVALLFIPINYLLVIEPNFERYSNKDRLIKKDSLLQSKIVDMSVNPTDEMARKKDSLTRKQQEVRSHVNEIKKEISNAKDAMSVVKILLFINDGWKHFAVFLTFIIAAFVGYIYMVRMHLLNLLASALRIRKTNAGLTEFYEYDNDLLANIWLVPIPKGNSFSVSQEDLLNVLSLRNRHGIYSIALKVSFAALILVQLRLHFIEQYVNGFVISFYTGLSFVLIVFTILVAVNWFRDIKIPDYFNDETVRNPFTRRDFVRMAAVVLPVTALGMGLPFLPKINTHTRKISSRIFNNPRFRSKKKPSPVSPFVKIERQSLKLVQQEKLSSAVNLLYVKISDVFTKKHVLFTEQSDVLSSDHEQHVVRLCDLLIRLVIIEQHSPATSEGRKKRLSAIRNYLTERACSSNNKQLVSRSVRWARNNAFRHNQSIVNHPNCIVKWDKKILVNAKT